MKSPVDRSAIVASWARIVFDAPHVGPGDVFYTRAVPGMEAGWYVRASVLAPAIPLRIGANVARNGRSGKGLPPRT